MKNKNGLEQPPAGTRLLGKNTLNNNANILLKHIFPYVSRLFSSPFVTPLEIVPFRDFIGLMSNIYKKMEGCRAVR